MWRSTIFPEEENSDQSISEDDDSNGDLPEDHVSLGIPAEEKGKVQILSQLDMLRDANEVMDDRHQTRFLQQRQVDICVEDDVEFPYFTNMSNFTHNPQETSACNSDEEILSDNEVGENCMELSKDLTLEADNYQKTKTKSTSEQLADKRSILLSINHDYIEDDPDCLDSDSSEEDEDNHQIQGLVTVPGPGPKQKTIADQFHEALGDASTNEVGHIYAGFGLFGKLQRVMQSEKERDLYFLSKLQKEDEASCLDVKILSKSLEGKLTVCSCSCSTSKNLTIIFSSRICSDVELDVGLLVRIHPPWKQVNVKGKQENTILSTYFTQI